MKDILHGRLISCGLWPRRWPDLTNCDFYLRGSLQYKDIKTNPHTLEERRNISREVQQLPGKKARELITCSAGTLSAFGQKCNILCICCSSGGFSLHFLKANLVHWCCRTLLTCSYGRCAFGNIKSPLFVSVYTVWQICKTPDVISLCQHYVRRTSRSATGHKCVIIVFSPVKGMNYTNLHEDTVNRRTINK